MTPRTMARLWVKDHLTLRQIGRLAGLSQTMVWKHMKALGVSSQDATNPTFICQHCGKPYRRARSYARVDRPVFCGRRCYVAAGGPADAGRKRRR
jgi:hypothetical protein